MTNKKLKIQNPETKPIGNQENSSQLLCVKKEILSDIILGFDVISEISDDFNLDRNSVEDSIINLLKKDLMTDKSSLTHLFHILQPSAVHPDTGVANALCIPRDAYRTVRIMKVNSKVCVGKRYVFPQKI